MEKSQAVKIRSSIKPIHLAVLFTLSIAPLHGWAADSENDSAATELPEVTVEASKEKLSGERLYPDEGYQSRGATVGSKTETNLKDIPQSISVINNELLRDVPVARINQLADYVAGVEPFASAATPYTNAFFFRGFGSTTATTFNGYQG